MTVRQKLAELFVSGEHCALVLAIPAHGYIPSGHVTCIDTDTVTISSDYPEHSPRVWVLSMSAVAGVLTGGQF